MPTFKKPVFIDKIPGLRGKTAKVGKTEAPFRPVFRVKRPFLVEKSAEFCGPLKKERTPPAKLNFSDVHKKGGSNRPRRSSAPDHAAEAGRNEFFRDIKKALEAVETRPAMKKAVEAT